jgi:hypothetical protein
MKKTGNTSLFPEEVVNRFLEHGEAIQDKSSDSEDEQSEEEREEEDGKQINSELAEVIRHHLYHVPLRTTIYSFEPEPIPHGPMRKPKVKRRPDSARV